MVLRVSCKLIKKFAKPQSESGNEVSGTIYSSTKSIELKLKQDEKLLFIQQIRREEPEIARVARAALPQRRRWATNPSTTLDGDVRHLWEANVLPIPSR